MLVFLVFALHGAYPVPDSNEAHYLAKARHYWDPVWAAGDQFLESSDAHQTFYWTFGWLTLWLPLETVAWTGRAITWLLLAWGWRRLSEAIVPLPLFSLLTAAAFVGLSEAAHMAGEWVVGGIEAKGIAYAAVFFALAALVREQWRTAWILLGVAAAMHVLVGGWSMVGAAVAWFAAGNRRPLLSKMLPAVAIAVVLALPSVWFGISLTQGIDTETIRQANYIYVFERLPHHLSATGFSAGFVARHLLLALVWLLLITMTPLARPGERHLRWFVATALALALTGFALSWVFQDSTEWLAALMRFYWFRSSDVFVPVGAAVALLRFVVMLLETRMRIGQLWLGGLLTAIALDSFQQFKHLPVELPWRETMPTPRADKNVEYDDWMDVCRWINENTPTDARVLTPRGAATFKWRTGRAEVATWKDVPQDAPAIVRWWDRLNSLYATGSDDPDDRWHSSIAEAGVSRVAELVARYEVDYLIVPLRDDVERLPVKPLYENASYAVYGAEQFKLAAR